MLPSRFSLAHWYVGRGEPGIETAKPKAVVGVHLPPSPEPHARSGSTTEITDIGWSFLQPRLTIMLTRSRIPKFITRPTRDGPINLYGRTVQITVNGKRLHEKVCTPAPAPRSPQRDRLARAASASPQAGELPPPARRCLAQMRRSRTALTCL